MRSLFAAIVICLACINLSKADPAARNVKLTVDVPPQALESALQAYTRETGFHVVYISEDVHSRRSAGAVGKLTADEALTKILSGTGLTYRFLDAHTISIVPAGSGTGPTSGQKGQGNSVAKPTGETNTASNNAATQVPVTGNPRSSEVNPSAGRPTDAGLLQAVVVTAERRRENAQTVPIAITALDQRAIREDHIQSTVDLQQFVPSLVVSGLFTPNDGIFAIRGESETGRNVGGGPGGGPSVVAYFADVPTSAAGPGLFYDLENVQVLKGPQGTLFGRNTTAGAILFEPRRPSKLFEGYGQITHGNYNDAEYEGAVNLPIVNDKLMLRVSGLRMSREGYTKDMGPYFAGRDYGNVDSWSGRVSLLFTPSDAVENYLVASAIDWKDNGPGTVVIGVNPSKAAVKHPALLTYLAEAQAFGPRGTSLDTSTFDVFRNYSVIDHFTVHLNDDYLVKNIVSYSHEMQNNARDDDGMPVPLLNSLGADLGRWHMAPITVTEELQAQGKSLGERLQWQAGGYYEHVSDSSENFAQRQNFDTADLHLDNEDFQSWSRALYGQATYDLGPFVSGLKFTAGYRYTWDSLRVGVSEGPGYVLPTPGRACFLQPAGTVYPNCTLTEGAAHAGDSWVLGLDYQVNHDTFAYLTSRHGYKSGGFNILSAAVGGAANPFFNYKPETDTDVEIGVKTDWSLGQMRARTNIDAFYTMYNDAQVTIAEQITTGQIQGVTQNAAEARLKGVELEGILVPWKALSLNVSYSYNDGAYDRFYSPAAGDLSGTPIQYMPRNKFNVGARYTLPLRADLGNVSIRADYSWQSRYFRSGTVLDPFAYIPAYSLLNAGLDWNDVAMSGLDVSLWVTNATNTLYRLSNEPLYTSAFGFSTTTYGPPRMYGGTLRYRF